MDLSASDPGYFPGNHFDVLVKVASHSSGFDDVSHP